MEQIFGMQHGKLDQVLQKIQFQLSTSWQKRFSMVPITKIILRLQLCTYPCRGAGNLGTVLFLQILRAEAIQWKKSSLLVGLVTFRDFKNFLVCDNNTFLCMFLKIQVLAISNWDHAFLMIFYNLALIYLSNCQFNFIIQGSAPLLQSRAQCFKAVVQYSQLATMPNTYPRHIILITARADRHKIQFNS